MTDKTDTWFQSALALPEDAVAGIKEALLPELLELEGRNRQRAMNRRMGLAFENALIAIIANVAWLEADHTNKKIIYQRSQPQRRPQGADGPYVTSRALNRVADLLETAGYTKNVTGQRSMFAGDKATASTIQPTEKLVSKIEELGVDVRSVAHPAAQACVFKKGADGEYWELPVDHDTAHLIEPVEAYNAFLRESDVRLPIIGDGPLQYSEKPVAGVQRLFHAELTHGRLYQSQWQNLDKEKRARILINGEETIEADFSGMTLRMIYHQAGMPFHGDPYAVPGLIDHVELLGMGMTPEQIRSDLKQAINKMLNVETRTKAAQYGKDKLSILETVRPSVVRNLTEEYHNPIVNHFYNPRLGAERTRIESDICLEIIDQLRQNGVLALPIHDSFVVARSMKALLLETMITVYREHLGFDPVIRPAH